MQITLSQEQTQVLDALVKQGQYPSIEEAINAALLLLIDNIALANDDNNSDYLAWAEATQEKIALAQEQAQRGEVLNAEEVLSQLRDKIKTARKSSV